MTIRSKIHLFSTVWLVLVLCIINTSIYWLFYKQMTGLELERLQLQSEKIAQRLHEAGSQADATELLQAYLAPIEMIRIVNQQSHPVVTATKDVDYASWRPVYSAQETYQVVEKAGVLHAVGQVPMIAGDGSVMSLEVTTGLSHVQETMQTLLIVLLVASLVVLLPSFLAGRMLAKLIVEPIRSLIRTMEEIQKKGQFKKLELPVKSNDELYQMGDTFNKMMDILQLHFTKQQQFVLDASHELKTPLTVIEGYATMLKRWGMNKPELLEESVEAIYSEAVRMKKLTRQMLMLANPDEEANLDMRAVDVVELCEETSKWMRRTYEQEIRVEAQSAAVYALADESRLKQLLVILLDNALTYSQKAIRIEIAEQRDTVSLSVIDQGVGIPEEDLVHIFDRFYRVDKARARDTGGTGLGLSIAKRIVDVHNGRLDVQSEVGAGSRFTVTLPKAAREKAGENA
ncbi:ATP-binding protein [Brevibacillus sp. HD1.4A]|uniref:sensor histidine kinase n=1 Tax=Brevibacillus sp. HD1.4A TaxID=2738978 RepID=UPI00156BA825|nr:ATP-binding protein [Brevibacillus sp. HD1.4A]NRQ54579.1 HAMP domain-containing protein [Brevibacillus sp. HD1.4A]